MSVVEEHFRHQLQALSLERDFAWARQINQIPPINTDVNYLISKEFLEENAIQPLELFDQWLVKLRRNNCRCQLVIQGLGPMNNSTRSIAFDPIIVHRDTCGILSMSEVALRINQGDLWCVHIRKQKCWCTGVIAGIGSWTCMTRVDLNPGLRCGCPHQPIIFPFERYNWSLVRTDRVERNGIGPCDDCFKQFCYTLEQGNDQFVAYPPPTSDCLMCKEYICKVQTRIYPLLPAGVNPYRGGGESTKKIGVQNHPGQIIQCGVGGNYRK